MSTACRWVQIVPLIYEGRFVDQKVDEENIDLWFKMVTKKLNKSQIAELKAKYSCIGKPFNLSTKYWIGVDANTAPDALLQELTRNSYEIVKAKYKK